MSNGIEERREGEKRGRETDSYEFFVTLPKPRFTHFNYTYNLSKQTY